ncbi:autotransporter domain-containing protein [Belnapia rosea]|uniref:Autotransporter-associated beta strand repeat-containing protein n=1 Tax=Belnapia rosea TaxID=938405 RepID=A0A1G6VPH8_9PROT|nr:autotransporter domain-containing protein [Belnapia rosea]SDD54765.1 autotransporter-associated beta strand repeat-containing protein [Belnapia rosea]
MTSIAALPVVATIGGSNPALSQQILTGNQTLTGTINGGRTGGYMVQSGSLTINNGSLLNFRTVGGAGSGGGAGMGGAIFINSGASATLNNVNIIGNSAVGGLGGTTALTGGVLNGMPVPGPAATGAAGFTWEDNRNLVGDGNGNGLPGTYGRAGDSGAGLGGTGGRGGNGQEGWSNNPTLEAAVATASLTVTSVGLALANAYAANVAACANPLTANLCGTSALEIVQATIDVADAGTALGLASAALADWNSANNRGQVGLGGDGGAGGDGGVGGFGAGGGAGGAGGNGGAGGGAARDGIGGAGGAGGMGGFGAGGGRGGDGGYGDLRGAAGAGGMAGFGGGVGSNGTGQSAPNSLGGGGGAGLGGGIFVREGGTLLITGDAYFSGNNAIGGSSQNRGGAGDSAGADLFMMAGSTVILNPGAGHVITFNGAISDTTKPKDYGPAEGGPTSGAGLSINSGLVIFNGTNTYSGATVLNGGVLRATDGVGLGSDSNLTFNGGVFETSGSFARFLGPENGRVNWIGSGGFAARGGDLTVTLNEGLGISWATDSFVPTGRALLFGSDFSDGRVTLTNDIDLNGGVGTILVKANGNAASDAVLTGVLSNGSLVVGGGGHNGRLTLTAANTYAGTTLVNSGAALLLAGEGGIANSSTVTVNGLLDIVATNAGASLVSLAGNGQVALGDRTLTLTNARGLFAGSIGGSGGLTIAGGAEALSGTNTYTGRTAIQAGASLSLSGGGSIAASSGVTVDGLLNISPTSAGAAVASLSGNGQVALGSQTLTLTNAGESFAGGISGNGGITVAGGTQALAGTNTYTGRTAIQTGAGLALTGNGSIAASSGVAADGLLDISATAAGASVTSLSGNGQVALGSQTLTLTNAGETFAGSIDGSGGVTVAGGTQALAGTNTYTGRTDIRLGAGLVLVGNGNLAASGVTADGLFDISATAAGASVASLSGNGQVALGGQTLTLTNAGETFAGGIDGSGGVTVAGGTQALAGTSTYTGRTNIQTGAALALLGTGSIAASSGVTADGLFDISATTAGASVTSLSGNGQVALGEQTLTLTNAGEAFAGSIGGSGGVTVAGGTETLSGTNTYTGRTDIRLGAGLVLTGSGSVAASSGVVADGLFDISATTAGASVTSLSGSGQVALGGQTLTLTNAGETFAGSIGGSGGLAVSGGTQSLAGVNGYTGRTTIQAGAGLVLTGNGSIASSSGIATDGLFDISATTAGASITSLSGSGQVALGGQTLTLTNAGETFVGSIGGAGGLAITGGTQTLAGLNTYGGGTLVSNAVLVIGNDAAMGAPTGNLTLQNGTLRASTGFSSARDITLVGNGTVDTNRQQVQLGGSLGGTGGLTAAGGGVLTLSGVNTYAGGTRIIEATTLAVASDAALGAASGGVAIGNGKLVALGDLRTTRAITVNTDGAIDSNGHAVSLEGPVTMVVDQNETLAFTGTSRVIGPLTLTAQGLTVDANATLRGTGVVTTSTEVLGTLAPGNSPGTLTFTAPLTLAAGSTLALDIDGTGTGTGAGNYSRVLVQGAGSSFTAGGTLRPILRGITGDATNAFTPSVGQSFQVVQSDNGINGSFRGLVQPTDGLLNGSRFDALYGSNAITLYVTPTSYANLVPFGVGLTRNQTSTGQALDALRPAAGVRTDAATTDALGTLFSLTPSAMPTAFDHLAPTIYGDALIAGVERSRLFGGAVAEQAAARRGDTVTPGLGSARGASGITAWATGLGQNARFGAAGGTSFHTSSGGAAVGADMRLNAGFLAGAAVGYSGGRTTSRATGASADVEMLHMVAYGGWTHGRFFVDGQFGLNHADVTTRRNLGVFRMQARGKGDGWGVNTEIQIGARYELAGWRLQPSLGLRYDELGRDQLTETGGGALALTVRSDELSSLRSMAGARVERRFDLGNGYRLTPTGRLFWTHELADVTTSTTAAFANTNAAMRTASAKSGRDGAIVGVGANLDLPNGLMAYVNYNAQIRDNTTAQAFTGGLRFAW